MTTVECQGCKNKSYVFENFYTISVPIPYQSKAIFYVSVIRRSSLDVIPPIIKYGIQIDKNNKLIDLLAEIEKLSKMRLDKTILVEIVNNKIFRSYDDGNMMLRDVIKKTSELTAIEFNSRV